MRYRTPPKETQVIFNREWKRAKKLASPLFNKIQKPHFYVLNSLWRLSDNAIGIHYSGTRGLHKINGYWKTGDLIIIRNDLVGDKLVDTIRHEICHCLYRNHKSQFQNLLKGLSR